MKRYSVHTVPAIVFALLILTIPVQGIRAVVQSSLSVQISDFQVNENEGTCGHRNPQVAADGLGRFVAVWEDDRNVNTDIYAQQFDADGHPYGSNFKVSDVANKGIRRVPAIGMNAGGRFVVAWREIRNDLGDIYARCFDESGNPTGPAKRVNDETGSWDHNLPYAAMGPDGSSVVVWWDTRGWMVNIYIQRFNKQGNPLGANIKVTEDGSGIDSFNRPSVCMEPGGGFMVFWYALNGLNGRRFDNLGKKTGLQLKLNNVSIERFGTESPVSAFFFSDGHWTAAWQDSRPPDYGQYVIAQSFNARDKRIGYNSRISQLPFLADQGYPKVVAWDSISCLILWQCEDGGIPKLYGQRMDSSGSRIGGQIDLQIDSSVVSIYKPDFIRLAGSRLAAVWQETKPGKGVFGQLFDVSGDSIGPPFALNDDTGSSFQRMPAIAVNGRGCCGIVWADDRNGTKGVYFQLLDSLCGSTGGAVRLNRSDRLNDDIRIASTVENRFIAVWNGWGTNPVDQIAILDIDPIGGIAADPWFVEGWIDEQYPDVAACPQGLFMVAWRDYVIRRIVAKRFDVHGVNIGGILQVDDAQEQGTSQNPSIASNAKGDFVVVWSGYRSEPEPAEYVLGQRFDVSGNRVGDNIRISNPVGMAEVRPCVAMDPAGGFLVVWDDYGEGGYGIWVRRYTSDGISLDSAEAVFKPVSSAFRRYPRAAMNDRGNCVVVWQDDRNGDWDIYGQLFDATGNRVGSPLRINQDQGPGNQMSPSITIRGDLVYTVWQDSRVPDQGWDVFMNVCRFVPDSPGGLNEPEKVLRGFELYQNYPNPFNQSTHIQYEIPIFEKVLISVTNLEGRLVCVLFDGVKTAGRHSVEWDGLDSSGKPAGSGVYFCRMHSGSYFMIKKIVLLK